MNAIKPAEIIDCPNDILDLAKTDSGKMEFRHCLLKFQIP